MASRGFVSVTTASASSSPSMPASLSSLQRRQPAAALKVRLRSVSCTLGCIAQTPSLLARGRKKKLWTRRGDAPTRKRAIDHQSRRLAGRFLCSLSLTFSLPLSLCLSRSTQQDASSSLLEARRQSTLLAGPRCVEQRMKRGGRARSIRESGFFSTSSNGEKKNKKNVKPLRRFSSTTAVSALPERRSQGAKASSTQASSAAAEGLRATQEEVGAGCFG